MVSDSCFAFLLSRVSGVAAARKENFRFDCQSAAVLLFIYFLYLAGRMPKDRRLLPSCPPPRDGRFRRADAAVVRDETLN